MKQKREEAGIYLNHPKAIIEYSNNMDDEKREMIDCVSRHDCLFKY